MRYVKEMIIAPFEVLRNFYRYRHILVQMVLREIKGRFAGSIGGLLWNFVHPIFMLLVYLFVFAYIFKLRVSVGSGSGASVIFLIAGLLPWIIIAEGLSRGTTSLIENANLIQKTSFPIEILPAKAVLAPILSHGIAILLLALYKIVFAGSFEIIFILPLILLLQIFFTLGIAFFTAALSVFSRDVMQLVNLLISFWMYLTPILYPITMLPDWAGKIMYLNPLYPLISAYQVMFLEGKLVAIGTLGLLLFWSVGLFGLGAFIFNKLKYEFADWL